MNSSLVDFGLLGSPRSKVRAKCILEHSFFSFLRHGSIRSCRQTGHALTFECAVLGHVTIALYHFVQDNKVQFVSVEDDPADTKVSASNVVPSLITKNCVCRKVDPGN